MDEAAFWPGVAFGALCLWAYNWYNEPLAIWNYRQQEAQSVALVKIGSGQVAIFHGFLDDYMVCDDVARYLQSQGGAYMCWATDLIPKNP